MPPALPRVHNERLPHAGALLGDLGVEPVLAAADGPPHARNRRATMATFPASPGRARAYEPMIRAIAADLVEQMAPAGEADLIRGFAWEMPLLVILTLLGVAPEDHERIKRWSDGRMALVWGAPSEDEQTRLATDIVAFWGFCQELAAQRMRDPGDDLISALVTYRGDDDAVMTEREIVSVVFDYLTAGHETMSNLLCNGILALLSTGAWKELVDDPSRIPGRGRGDRALRHLDRRMAALHHPTGTRRRRRDPRGGAACAVPPLGQSRRAPLRRRGRLRHRPGAVGRELVLRRRSPLLPRRCNLAIAEERRRGPAMAARRG